jgi:RNA polymerase sigma-70 factor (ECF subfamily)
MISAYSHLGSFRGDSRNFTWLVTIAMNEGRKRLRRSKAAGLESLDEVKEATRGDFTSCIDGLAERSLRRRWEKGITRKVRSGAGLPNIYREVVVLRDLEELNQEETAAALGPPISLVKVRNCTGANDDAED